MAQIHEIPLKGLFKKARLGASESLRIAVVPDIHFRTERIGNRIQEIYDKKAVGSVKRFLKDYRPHVLMILGDFFDCNCVSHWEQNCDAQGLIGDLQAGGKLLSSIKKACGKRLVYSAFLQGNHELWVDQTIQKKIKDFGQAVKQVDIDLSFESLAGLKNLGFDYYKYNDLLRIGHACFTHGMYTNRYHAAKHTGAAGATVFYGHAETIQVFTDNVAMGVRAGVCVGTLRLFDDAKFMRNRPNNWLQGFGLVEMFDKGHFTFSVHSLIHGKLSYGGKVYG